VSTVIGASTETIVWRGIAAYLRLQDVGAPMLVLGPGEVIEDLTATAGILLAKFDLPHERGAALPPALASELRDALLGEAILWRARETGPVLGCTRYWLGERNHLLLMREITERHRAMSSRMHQQRLEEVGKLIAHIAHDLRAPLASIVYNADLLARRDLDGSNELVGEIQLAADNLRRTIAGLLDFVRLGPPVSSTMSLRALTDRVSSLLRPVFRAGQHELIVALHDGDVRISGNLIGIEQIFVNLLVNAIEATSLPARIEITSESLERSVLVRVRDDGPGIPMDLRAHVFDAFVTSKPQGTGLGLTRAREIALSLGGQLTLEETAAGCSFAVVLPASPPAQEIA
jgi:signal transduction histidine kinase